MTFDDDVVRINFAGDEKIFCCKNIGLSWPPPEKIDFMGIPMKRTSMSTLTDDERSKMTHVCRGAEYEIDQARAQ